MNEPITIPERRKRRQALSEEGRTILQRERQRIAREQAVLGERLANEARRNADRQRSNESRLQPEAVAVQRGMVKNIGAVLASESVNVRLDVAPGHKMVAWTDFSRIHIRYREHEDKRLLAATLRGLMYHEGGHCRWSDPFTELQEMVAGKEHLIPGLLPPLDDDGNQPRILWTRYHRPWNALEDQRMETAVVSDSPVKAKYLTPMMMTELMETPEHAVANWPLLIWRRYLPRKLRASARRDFVAIYGEALAQRFEAVVDSYVRATDAVTMVTAVVEMHGLLELANIKLDDFGHAHQGRKRKVIRDEEGNDITPPQEPTPIPILPDFEAEEEEEEDEAPIIDTGGTPVPADDVEDESDGEAGDGQGDSESEAEGTPEAGDHSKPIPPKEDKLTQEDIDEAKAEAEAERDADPALDGDVEAYHNAMEDRTSDLSPYIGGFSEDAEAAIEAEGLAAEIERSFQAATMDRQPAWVENQRRGIINVARYETRQPGETNFYRDWVEDHQPGFNMAVSLMLDYSSSMSGYTKELSQTAYAVKLACQRLGIPCTVTLWDTDATVLYDATEQADGMIAVQTAGATDPTPGLADLENQRFDKVNHVVLIMTDGEWQGQWSKSANGWGGGRMRAQADRATLAYHTEDRLMVGFGFAKHELTAKRYAENLVEYGCPEAFGITNLMEIPERLRDILIALA